MRRQTIITLLIVAAVAGGGYAAYRFFFKATMDEYAENKQFLADLEEKQKDLADEFQNFKPELFVEAYESRVAPYRQRVDYWSEYFTFPVADANEDIEPPQDPTKVKFWYEDEITKRRRALLSYVRKNRVLMPEVTFGAAQVNELTGTDVSNLEALIWLRSFDAGDRMVRQLVEGGATSISQIQCYKDKKAGTFRWRRYGLVFDMKLADLGEFLNKGIEADLENPGSSHFRNFVDLRVRSLQPTAPEPLLRVETILIESQYVAQEAPTGYGPRPQDRLRSLGGDREDMLDDRPKRTWWQQFRKKWLPF